MIHPSAEIASSAKIGKRTKIWHHAQIRENVLIGSDCIISKGVYIDKDSQIGNTVKIQNYTSVYHQTVIEDGVFIGPYVCVTNDKFPRSTTNEGKLKTDGDWKSHITIIKQGASIGAGSILLPGLTIGEFSLVGAGSLVTRDVPSHALIYGSPARIVGFVCRCGNHISRGQQKPKILWCIECLKK
ncbi:hypothetical protein A3C32_04310 [Candidatus Daviesbacteria bacterium RIFCSPHIGHO2_02_FULL_41_14]|uniref:N-acetyltransferase n=1 Tax=Candidatus Daviesbacteria bacterium RIFCSPLOWO2_01_FULL_40_24 TaxID=1797787 RepID=A0A1F5MJH2_9BACT|nr:MAG: hypothetical protein A3C32_04310 [Candidatus Daviesbacteria bacterium RIFCSPHIGHO2_02_FULL_41_14]OGE65450.1 MAG: hypothetical protein A3B49_01005 [Candidatus Daviesbacteria bacterium RIFCSPLOWO2_01_FULL_40_24]